MEETPKETPLTDHIVKWAAEHGLEIAPVEVPVIRHGGVMMFDELNFLNCPRPTKWEKIQDSRGYYKVLVWASRLKQSLIEKTYRFRKLPDGVCCWYQNMCYDVECKDCGSRDWACAYCGYLPPCVEDACKDKDFA
jgi:hypothetical protein